VQGVFPLRPFNSAKINITRVPYNIGDECYEDR